MKRGKDEEKIMGPMFPRLHVNDPEKGGPKAPPRNKMALYEQLSIPSQRFNHSNNNKAANSEPPSNQGAVNERAMFHSIHLPTRHHSEKPYSQYSDFTIPLTQAKQRKKSDEDDFRVPIFVQSLRNQESGKYANGINTEKLSPSNPSNFNRALNFHKFKKTGMIDTTTRQEGKSQKAESLMKQPDPSVCLEPSDNPANNSDRLETHETVERDLEGAKGVTAPQHVSGDNFAALDKINSSEKGSQHRSFRTVHKRNLERVDSVSETSVLDSNQLDMTPDDVVGIIGQKRFWKARKAILNQQRIFAIQVFELHRLVKVQKLIAASPQLLVDESSYSSRSTKAPSAPKLPLNCPVNSFPTISKQKSEHDKPSHKKEISAENTIGKPSTPSFQTAPPLPPTHPPLNGPASTNPNARPWCFNQPQGHQWLIPVMSPSEGLVYKPYPGPGFATPACNGCGPPGTNPLTGSFLAPAYGIPAPPPPFPPAGPHGYFPTYGMPIMNGAAISVSSVEQPNPPPSGGDLHHHQKNRVSPDALNGLYAEVQASTASSRVERVQDSRGKGNDEERTNVLSLFPVAPAMDASNSSPNCPRSGPTQVIKVVPHNARSATESAARIFRSIQEERKQ